MHAVLSRADRSDLPVQVRYDSWQMLLDVTIVTPTADSHMKRYNESLATAEKAARRKIEHYKQIAIDSNAQFISSLRHQSARKGSARVHQDTRSLRSWEPANILTERTRQTDRS